MNFQHHYTIFQSHMILQKSINVFMHPVINVKKTTLTDLKDKKGNTARNINKYTLLT